METDSQTNQNKTQCNDFAAQKTIADHNSLRVKSTENIHTPGPAAKQDLEVNMDDMNDKYDAAEGLLLLGTDASSVDDSQTAPNLNLDIPNQSPSQNIDDNKSDASSDKTIILPSLCAETPLLDKFPKKGVNTELQTNRN